jgi:3'(2'), 5'-bisphosphate nucleotidase
MNYRNSFMSIDDPIVRFAVETVKAAAGMLKMIHQSMDWGTMQKSDRTPVTVADFSVQAMVGRLFEQSLRDDILVAEEKSDTLKRSEHAHTRSMVLEQIRSLLPEVTVEQIYAWIDRGKGKPTRRFWTLDPLDGTKGFLRSGQFAVSLGLVEDGQVKLGVIGCPVLGDDLLPGASPAGELFLALQGQGSWRFALDGQEEGTSISVSETGEPEKIQLLQSYASEHTDVLTIDRLMGMWKTTCEPLRIDSQVKFGLLASGRGDLLLRLLSPQQPDYREKIWDIAPGCLLVQEAGGMMTDLDGKPLDFTTGREMKNNRGIVATNGYLHEFTLQSLKRVGI